MGGIVDKVLGTPQPPDPNQTAAAQSKANLDALYASAGINQMGINMPGYNISYTGDIGDPNRTMNYTLSPENQALQSMVHGGVSNIGNNMSFMPDFSGVAPIPGNNDFSADAQHVEDTTFDALMSRLRPEQERGTNQLLTQLNVSGNPLGSEGYNTEMDRMSQQTSDQNLQAAMAAMNAGRAEQGRLFGQGVTANQVGMANATTENQLPYSNLAQLLSMDPTNVNAPGMPNYQMQAPDIAGLIQGNYQQQSANQNAMLGGFAGLGAAALLAPSDRRLKHNIVPRGTLPSGIPVYDFSYIGSDVRHTGVMAQDVLPVIPEAVVVMNNGYYAVNYGLLH